MRLGGGRVEGREEKKRKLMRYNRQEQIPTVSRQHNVMPSRVCPLLSSFSSLYLKLIGENSNMPNIHHSRPCRECITSGYDDEYRGSGAEKRGRELFLFL